MSDAEINSLYLTNFGILPSGGIVNSEGDLEYPVEEDYAPIPEPPTPNHIQLEATAREWDRKYYALDTPENRLRWKRAAQRRNEQQAITEAHVRANPPREGEIRRVREARARIVGAGLVPAHKQAA